MRPKSAALRRDPNVRANSYLKETPHHNPFPTSVPSVSDPSQPPVILKCQNAFKLYEYQRNNYLADVDASEVNNHPYNRNICPAPPSLVLFPQKKPVEKLDFQEFMRRQYPPPFNGDQAYKEEDSGVNLNCLHIQKIAKKKEEQAKQEQKESISMILSARSEEEENETLVGINKQILQREIAAVAPQVPEEKRKTLVELLMLNQQEKDVIRAMPMEKQKELKAKLIVEEVKVAELPKMSAQEMMKHLEENKKDYLKIVNDLDLLKKGARDLKNKTGQKFSLRKKVETPDIKKMIEEVKGTKWYTPGMLDDYKREMDVIRERNKDIDKRFEVDDEKVDDLLREVPPGLNDVKLKERGKNGQEKQLEEKRESFTTNNQGNGKDKLISKEKEKSLINQEETQSSINQSSRTLPNPSIKISQKAKQMEDMMKDIF